MIEATEKSRIHGSIVIVTHGQWALTEQCLRSLELSLGPKLGSSWEVIVVDNDSPDETPERLRAWPGPGLTAETLAENVNFAGGCNCGARIAHGEVLVFLNNDTEVPAGALEALAEQTLEPGVGATGCRLLFPDDTIQHGGIVLVTHRHEGGAVIPEHVLYRHGRDLSGSVATFETDCVTAACLAVRRTAFNGVGGFDENFRNGYEDVDLCLRLRTAGHKIIYRGDIDVTHHEGASRRDPAGPDSGAVTTSHDEHNRQLLLGRWRANLAPDDETTAQVWDGALRDSPPVRGSDPVADVVLLGSPSAIGPAADETRAWLVALTLSGRVPCAHDQQYVNVVARPSGSAGAVLRMALRLLPHPDAPAVVFPSGRYDRMFGGTGPLVPNAHARVRLGTSHSALPLASVGQILAASQAVADELVAQGLNASTIKVVPPPITRRALGYGGAGLLVVLPVQSREIVESILSALAALGNATAVRLLPTVFRRELAAELATRLPGAELLPPCSDEERFAALAGEADLVLAGDPWDMFDRSALVSASVGTHAVSLNRTGPFAELAGTGLTCHRDDLRSVLATLVEPAQRSSVAEPVRETCAPTRITALAGLPPTSA